MMGGTGAIACREEQREETAGRTCVEWGRRGGCSLTPCMMMLTEGEAAARWPRSCHGRQESQRDGLLAISSVVALIPPYS